MLVHLAWLLILELRGFSANPGFIHGSNKEQNCANQDATEIQLVGKGLLAVKREGCVRAECFIELDIYLQGNALTEIKPGIFGNKARILNLSFNNLKRIDDQIFANLSALLHLYCTDNQISKVAVGAFENNKRIVFIDLSNNFIKNLDNVFAGMMNLFILCLSNNPLESIQHMDSPSLKTLNLKYTSVQNYDTFNSMSLPGLQTLKICGWNISSLMPYLLSNTSNVVTLQLEKCSIKSIDFNTFKPLEKLKTLSLANNRLCTLPDFGMAFQSDLEKLDLRQNFFVTINGRWIHPLYNLKELHLDYNQITRLDPNMFKVLENLRHLSLEGNMLEEYDYESESLKELIVSHNKLKRFNGKIVPNLELLHYIKRESGIEDGISSRMALMSMPKTLKNVHLEHVFNYYEDEKFESEWNFCNLESIIERHVASSLAVHVLKSSCKNELKLQHLEISMTSDINRALPPLMMSTLYGTLNLSNSDITDFSIEQSSNKSLVKQIDLSHNSLSVFVLKEPFHGEFLRLEYINLENCKLRSIVLVIFTKMALPLHLNLNLNPPSRRYRGRIVMNETALHVSLLNTSVTLEILAQSWLNLHTLNLSRPTGYGEASRDEELLKSVSKKADEDGIANEPEANDTTKLDFTCALRNIEMIKACMSNVDFLAGCAYLETLVMLENNLSHFDRNILSPHTKYTLKHLDLARNVIIGDESILSDLFVLETIDLHDNLLSIFTLDDTMPNVTFLNLSKNEIRKFSFGTCATKFLQVLDLSYNVLVNVEFSKFESLTYLNLIGNAAGKNFLPQNQHKPLQQYLDVKNIETVEFLTPECEVTEGLGPDCCRLVREITMKDGYAIIFRSFYKSCNNCTTAKYHCIRHVNYLLRLREPLVQYVSGALKHCDKLPEYMTETDNQIVTLRKESINKLKIGAKKIFADEEDYYEEGEYDDLDAQPSKMKVGSKRRKSRRRKAKVTSGSTEETTKSSR